MQEREKRLRVLFEQKVLENNHPNLKPVLTRALSDKTIKEGLFLAFCLGNCSGYEDILYSLNKEEEMEL